MSDALTDIRRDEELASLVREIRKKERDFMAGPAAEKARELFGLWKEYYHMPRGYWGAPNRTKALERLAFYHDWTPEKGLGPLPAYHRPNDVLLVQFGAGFIANISNFEELLAGEIRRVFGGRTDHTKYLVRVTVEPLEEVTCKNCPLFDVYCGGLYCGSKVPEELRERIEAAEGARKLVGNCS
ncbi:hypothetical protein SAMN02745218_02815 [Desulfofundulus australicus DSM 11792]|uniref:Uncharacterized protein n=1 Tax=Desulfofundulus australicus DSM 11792 TaxID=1121425 RepID=A0A1M5DGA3_9FIRM|nr:hypothetical protein [Desulfofundulus australicus]SHF65997.1 hypothetical protein SAMN02745218_02815 [Desulfofundulus australicus DSM 11792]